MWSTTCSTDGRPPFFGWQNGAYAVTPITPPRDGAALISELGRRTSTETFDEQPVPDLNSEAIDFAATSQCFAERRPLRRQDLEALGLVSRQQGRTVPTVGGLLLFGKERLSRYPDTWIQAGRFSGTNRTELIDLMQRNSRA